MTLWWRPLFTYGAQGAQLLLTLPQRHWTPALAHTGGGAKAAIGIRERFTIRSEQLLEVNIRYLDAESEQVFDFLRWAQADAGGFTYHPDQGGATSYAVDLESPGDGEEIRPVRSAEPSVWEITLVLRRLDDGGMHDAYHPALVAP